MSGKMNVKEWERVASERERWARGGREVRELASVDTETSSP